MLARLAFLFVAVPLLELVILVKLGQVVGLWPTLALVLGTGVLGASLARREGLRTWMAVQRELAAGRMPGSQLLDALAVLVGGAFLLTPGLLTDVAGLLLLLPPTRRWVRGRVRLWLERQVASGQVRVMTFGLDPFDRSGEASGPPDRRGGLDPRHEIHQDDGGTEG